MGQADQPADVGLLAREVLEQCEVIARFSEEPDRVTRTFLCPAMQGVHDSLTGWMRAAGMTVRRDALGNLIGRYAAAVPDAPLLLIGSHLDSVPNAGKYDGVLGVLLGLAAVQALGGRRLPFAVDLLGFSEEEGIRYRTPYLGSRAVCGRFDAGLLERTDAAGVPLVDALRMFGLDPARIPEAAYQDEHLLGYLEAHIEQGPVLEAAQIPVGVVEAIAGQSRLWVSFHGKAGHAGTLPMEHRRDALSAAAELVLHVETLARSTSGLRGTVGTMAVAPGAVNVVPGSARLSLDIRHAQDVVREDAVAQVLRQAEAIAARRGVGFQVEQAEHHAAVPADPHLAGLLAAAVDAVGVPVRRLASGAGHDAAVMASIAPMAMLFVRSPGGISHHPDEAVLPADVETALKVFIEFLTHLPATLPPV
jgi:allantoate deiminase